MQLLNILNVASVSKELNFKFYLILIDLNLNVYMWLTAATVGSAGLEVWSVLSSCLY